MIPGDCLNASLQPLSSASAHFPSTLPKSLSSFYVQNLFNAAQTFHDLEGGWVHGKTGFGSGFLSDGSGTLDKSPVLAMWVQTLPYSGWLHSQKPLTSAASCHVQSMSPADRITAYHIFPSVISLPRFPPIPSGHSERERQTDSQTDRDIRSPLPQLPGCRGAVWLTSLGLSHAPQQPHWPPLTSG